ncbi:MAG: tlde1 domain-containing protein [Roseiarcus sp.]|jgi:hypothetical protein
MSQGIAAPTGLVAFDCGVSRQILSRTVPGAVALALGALFGVWIIYLRPVVAPDFRPPSLASAPNSAPAIASNPYGALVDPRSSSGSAPAAASAPISAPVIASNPYGALVGPGFLSGAAPAPLARRSALPSNVEAAAPSPLGAIREPATSPPPPNQTVSQSGENAPAPPPRPAELKSPAPAQVPDGRLTRRTAKTVAPVDNRNFLQKLFGAAQPSGPALAYAAPESGVRSDPRGGGVLSALRSATSSLSFSPSSLSRYDRSTAVYDIAAHTVYLPDGTRLEAHSGLGDRLDEPSHVNERNRGATPPDVYELELREQPFHGVQALRLKPVGDGDLFGRAGLLAHSYMLGPNGDSNGCVSFKDYDAFLRAYQHGRVKRLAVVARLD